MEISIQLLSEPQITRELFQDFERHQKVTKCWQKEWGIWALKDVCFVEEWNESQYQFLVECLKNTVNTKKQGITYTKSIYMGTCDI